MGEVTPEQEKCTGRLEMVGKAMVCQKCGWSSRPEITNAEIEYQSWIDQLRAAAAIGKGAKP